jgi:hypothetical protein
MHTGSVSGCVHPVELGLISTRKRYLADAACLERGCYPAAPRKLNQQVKVAV